MNAQRVMHNFLPQFPGSIVTPQQQQQHSNVGAKAAKSTAGVATTEKDEDDEDEATFSDLKAWAMSKPSAKLEEVVGQPGKKSATGEGRVAGEEKGIPAVKGETVETALTEREDPATRAQLKTNSSESSLHTHTSESTSIDPNVEIEQSDTEPVDLSTRGRDSTPPASGSFTLTDDGRPVPAEELECPICGEEFEKNNICELVFHVDAHLATSRTCPICQQRFDARNEDGLKKHVDDHFAAEEFSMVDPEGSVSFNARETALQAGSNAFNRLRDFLDFD